MIELANILWILFIFFLHNNGSLPKSRLGDNVVADIR